MFKLEAKGETLTELKEDLKRHLNHLDKALDVAFVETGTTVLPEVDGSKRRGRRKGTKNKPDAKKPGRRGRKPARDVAPTPANDLALNEYEKEHTEELDPDDLLGTEKAPPVSAKKATYEQVKEAVHATTNKLREQGRDVVSELKTVLAKYNVTAFKELKPEHYSNVIQQVQSIA